MPDPRSQVVLGVVLGVARAWLLQQLGSHRVRSVRDSSGSSLRTLLSAHDREGVLPEGAVTQDGAWMAVALGRKTLAASKQPDSTSRSWKPSESDLAHVQGSLAGDVGA